MIATGFDKMLAVAVLDFDEIIYRVPRRYLSLLVVRGILYMLMVKKIILVADLLAIILLAVMMGMTTPVEIGPFGVLVFFMLVYVLCLGVCTGIMHCFFWLRGVYSQRYEGVVNTRKSYFYGSVIAFGPVMLLAAQSFGGLGWLEVSLIFFFVVVTCFLVSKRFDVIQ
jgi:hypothetical protein